MTRIPWALICWILIGCSDRTPQGDYDDFRSRTENYRSATCEESGTVADPNTDLTGSWLIRARLGAGLALGLRIEFERDGAPETRRYALKFWLHDQPEDAPQLVTTETVVDDEGRFTMIADPLDLGKDVVMSESAVLARVILNAGILDNETWCGGVSGQVTSPLNLDLDGSTFYAKRITPDVSYESLPSSCPETACEGADAGVSDGEDMALNDPSPVRPASPDLDGFESVRADLGGDWLMNISVTALNLSLWVSFFDRTPDQAGGLDGAVRLTSDGNDSPPRTQFFAPIDQNGRFEIWFPDLDLEIESPPLSVSANLLLSSVTKDGYWCGLGAGSVTEPLAIDLEGATFYAIPWAPDTEIPEDLPSACP